MGGTASSRKIILDKDCFSALSGKEVVSPGRKAGKVPKLLLMAKLHMKVDFIKKKLAAVKYGK